MLEAGGKVSSGVLMGMRVRLARIGVEGKSVESGVPPSPPYFAQILHSMRVRLGLVLQSIDSKGLGSHHGPGFVLESTHVPKIGT